MSVLVETSVGDIVIDLLTERTPLAAKNFLKLCKIKYYNNCVFFNVQKDLLVQTGDPTNTGKGGTSVYGLTFGDQAKYFEDEIYEDIRHTEAGVVAYAGSNGCNGSQFYITTRDDADYLDEKHTIFGRVAEGMDVVMKINETFCDETGRPYRNIRIKHTMILEDPFDDPVGLAEHIPSRSPSPIRDNTRLEEDEPVDDNEGLTQEEIDEHLQKKEAKSRAIVLEMIGDIPDAEVKPPENVLFVCKLNPVTREEDLELIFSRFGKIKSCNIIKDYKTGDSLCYAFIEFESEDSCEAAYFKMDNVLIDDRRIIVDFSQSVSRLWNKHHRGEHMRREDFTANGQPTTKPRGRTHLELRQKGTHQHGGGQYDMVFETDLIPSVPEGREKRHRSRSHERDRGRAWQRSRYDRRAGERDRRDRDRDRDRDRRDREDRNRDRDRDRDREDRNRDRDRDRDRDRRDREDRNRERERERERDRDRNRGSERRHRSRSRSRS